MSFGSNVRKEWVLGPEESRPIIERAIDLGINFYDTANAYSFGESERVLGDVLADYDRDWSVVATKVFRPIDENNPNSGGLSRKSIEQEIEASLDRLGMDTVDLYQIHRWDYNTPIEETLRALNDTVRRNQVRYLGASAMWAYQLSEALHLSEQLGLDRFVSMQNHYNLTYREEEREMAPLCAQEGVGMIPFSPLARGYLTRPDEKFAETRRAKFIDRHDRYSKRIAAYRANGGIEINHRVQELAADKDATMAQIALAWLLHQEGVDAPVVGTTSIEHLEDAVEAIDISLSSSDLEYLEEPYEPIDVIGHK